MAARVGAPPTVAIAFDGAEPTLVRRLMTAGDMPALAELAARGSWSRVTSSAHVGSASVWPTFASGRDPHEHGMHYVWRWEPERMRIAREHAEHIAPWWGDVARGGRRVLTLDVPLMPLTGAEGCAEISEWGPHDHVVGAVRARPARLVEDIARDPGPHPYQDDRGSLHDDPPLHYLEQISRGGRDGALMRGELARRLIADLAPEVAFVVFSEMHRSSHLLWQSVAPDDPLLAGRRGDGLDERALVDVFAAADAALGRIVDSLPPDARVLVFSLHGMRSARGVPTPLHPLLVALGYAAQPRGARMTPLDAGRTALAGAKARAPDWARQAWRRHASPALLNAVAEPTAMRPYDWDRTRAFCLPTDQHGWVRINLAGREARGIVAPSHYAGTCDEIAAALLAARTLDGRPLVRRVTRMADELDGRPPQRLPDLVVDWDDAAHDDPVRVAGTDVSARPDGLRLTGKHAYEGFLVAAGTQAPGDVVAGRDLHRIIAAG